MRLEHTPEEAQVGFGKADSYEGNVRHKGCYLDVSSPYSNGSYTQLFRSEDMQCLTQGQTNALVHVDRVPAMLWLDNAQAVLKKVLKNGEPERIEEFVRLNNHYGFSIPSCDPARAMKKATKDPAGYYRRDVLIPGLQVDDLKAFNLHLLEQYGQDMLGPHYSRQCLHEELLRDYRKALLRLLSVSRYESDFKVVRTNSYTKFTLNREKPQDSTACHCANSHILAKLTAHEIIVLDKNYREITRHLWLYGDDE